MNDTDLGIESFCVLNILRVDSYLVRIESPFLGTQIGNEDLAVNKIQSINIIIIEKYMSKNDEIKKILAEQYNIEIDQLDVFPGTNPDATPEEIALEIVKSIDEIILGKSEMIDLDD